jgi:hypothetical protein
MAYCSRCGTKNVDDARFCNKCGATLGGPFHAFEKPRDDKCEEECSGKSHSPTWTYFWIIILAIIAVGLVTSLILNLFRSRLPDWMGGFDFWDFCPLIVGIVIVIFVISALIRNTTHHKYP